VVAGVLVVVDEQGVRVPVLAPPRRGDVVRCPTLDLLGERQRPAAYVAEAVLGADPHVHVHALAAAGLRPADRPELVEDLVGHVRDPAHGGEVAERAGVEVDPPLVRLLGVGPPAVPRVELDGGHLHRPDDAAQLGHAELVGVPVVARKVHPHRLQPRGSAVRHPLLVDLLAGDSLGEPVHHARPLEERAHDAVPDGQVVLDQVQLGLPAGREVLPVRVRHPHDPVVHLDLDRRAGLRHDG
jgi:hypothetical protein